MRGFTKVAALLDRADSLSEMSHESLNISQKSNDEVENDKEFV